MNYSDVQHADRQITKHTLVDILSKTWPGSDAGSTWTVSGLTQEPGPGRGGT